MIFCLAPAPQSLRMEWAVPHVNCGVLFSWKELWIHSGFFDPIGLLPTNLCPYHQGCHFVLMHGGELRVCLIPWGMAIKPYKGFLLNKLLQCQPSLDEAVRTRALSHGPLDGARIPFCLFVLPAALQLPPTHSAAASAQAPLGLWWICLLGKSFFP